MERETPDGEIAKEYNEVIFDCDTSKTKPYQFNLFHGFSIRNHKIVNKKLAEEGLKVVNQHISILCNHKADGIKTTKYFYAQALQQPHILPNFCMVFISKEGVGKDMTSDFIENIFAEKYCFNPDKLDNLVGKFNSMFGAKIQGVINETNPVDSSQRRDNTKYVITAKKVQIEGKQKIKSKRQIIADLHFMQTDWQPSQLKTDQVDLTYNIAHLRWCQNIAGQKRVKNILIHLAIYEQS